MSTILGDIHLSPEYLIEIIFYNDAMDSFLLVEKEYYLDMAKMKKMVLFD